MMGVAAILISGPALADDPVAVTTTTTTTTVPATGEVVVTPPATVPPQAVVVPDASGPRDAITGEVVPPKPAEEEEKSLRDKVRGKME